MEGEVGAALQGGGAPASVNTPCGAALTPQGALESTSSHLAEPKAAVAARKNMEEADISFLFRK